MDEKLKVNEAISTIKAIAEMFMNADSSKEFTLSGEAVHRIGFMLFDAQNAIAENTKEIS